MTARPLDSSAKTMLESTRGVLVFTIYVLGPSVPETIYLLPEDAGLLVDRIAAIPEAERRTYYWTGKTDPIDAVDELARGKESQIFIKVFTLIAAVSRLKPTAADLRTFIEHVQAAQPA
jgi:hypothetical protein